ncbi:hypothetical protein [Pleomorphovibrio marinus]|uniref:hypothetical protein n=1 Tax=Pleomorphovibrio marinus TaxID=2164132 RepID=UPI000E0B6A73|nr:hypothetical protein [Pleomorphovibrio marinus]
MEKNRCWEKLSRASNPVNKNRAALEILEYQTRQPEFGHLIIFIVVAVLGIAVALLHGIMESFPFGSFF